MDTSGAATPEPGASSAFRGFTRDGIEYGVAILVLGQIDRQHLAVGFGQFAKKDGGKSAARNRHEGLAMLPSREMIAALKQPVFPPSSGRRPARLSLRARYPQADNTEAVSCPSGEAGLCCRRGDGPSEALIVHAVCRKKRRPGFDSRILRLSPCSASPLTIPSPVWLPRR